MRPLVRILLILIGLLFPAPLMADGCVWLEDLRSYLLQEGGAGRIVLEGQGVCVQTFAFRYRLRA
jgi:hypothetical protein